MLDTFQKVEPLRKESEREPAQKEVGDGQDKDSLPTCNMECPYTHPGRVGSQVVMWLHNRQRKSAFTLSFVTEVLHIMEGASPVIPGL